MRDSLDEVWQRLLNTADGRIGVGVAQLNDWRNIDASALMGVWWAGYLKAWAEARLMVLQDVPWTLEECDEDEEAKE